MVAHLGPAVRAVQGDVTVAADRERMVAGAVDHGGALDGLVLNAGNMYRGRIEQLEEGPLLELFAQNVVAAMMLAQEALPHLVARRGAMVFVGSAYTSRSVPATSAYTATKAALACSRG